MNENSTIDILKMAILLERRGKAFYSKAADVAENESVKAFFELMASEEDKHINVLSTQYKHYRKENKFIPESINESTEIASTILNAELKDKISAAGFEAAAISAAIAMEERAIRLYTKRAADSDNDEEKSLFQWLADWEKEHLRFLNTIEKELIETVWFDNNFWPF
ncbi:ferritin family protein [Thermodesulfobacteriota bacterium]